MSTGSLDILKNRVRSAVGETKILRAENERLKAELEAVVAKRSTGLGNPSDLVPRDRLAGNGSDREEVRSRLQGILRRLDRLEKRLSARDR